MEHDHHEASDPIPTPAEAAVELEQALFEAKRVLVGQDHMIERLFVAWLARGHCLLEGAPGLAKTLAAETVATIIGGPFARIQFTPDLVPVRPRRHPHLPPVDRAVRRRARPGLRQRGAGRRDQPGSGQGAVGAARGDGRAPRLDRRHDLRRARPVHRARHPEPDRERGRLPAARGPARPLPDEGRRRATPPPARRPRSSGGWASHRPPTEPVLDPESARRRSRQPPTRSSSHDAVLDYAVRLVMATRAAGRPRARRPRRADRPRRQPTGHPGAGRRRPGPRADAQAAATCSRRTSSTSAATCCATGCCCRSTRSPTASTPR